MGRLLVSALPLLALLAGPLMMLLCMRGMRGHGNQQQTPTTSSHAMAAGPHPGSRRRDRDPDRITQRGTRPVPTARSPPERSPRRSPANAHSPPPPSDRDEPPGQQEHAGQAAARHAGHRPRISRSWAVLPTIGTRWPGGRSIQTLADFTDPGTSAVRTVTDRGNRRGRPANREVTFDARPLPGTGLIRRKQRRQPPRWRPRRRARRAPS
jgi:hypothetical protein